MANSTSKESQLVSHILDRIRGDIQFLHSQSYITQDISSQIQDLLANATVTPQQRPNQIQFRAPSFNNPASNNGAGAPSALRRAVPPPPPQFPTPSVGTNVAQAKAMWDYEAADPADLSFQEGDIIEIISEDSADWWKGKLNGKEGLFPANYVEKIDAPASRAPIPLPPRQMPPAPSFPQGPVQSYGQYNPPPPPPNSFGYPNEKAVYSPPPQYGYQQPNGYQSNGYQQQNTYAPPPPQDPNAQGASGDIPPDPSKKPSKFGKVGKMMGTAAATGVGFGAGAAIGGGIVGAIL